MKNTFALNTQYFAFHQPRFNDFGFKMSDAESHYSFACLNIQGNQLKDLSFDVRLGFNFDNSEIYMVAMYEVIPGKALENGTQLVRISSQADLIQFFHDKVQPTCPVELFDGMLSESLKIYEVAQIDFIQKNGNFENSITKSNPFFESYYTVSENEADHHIAHIELSTDGIFKFHATALVKFDGTQQKLNFVVNELHTVGKLENAPKIGEAFSAKVQNKLNKMFYSNKYLGIRTQD